MSEILSGFCPNCGSKLRYESNDSTVTCFACDSTISVSDIGGNAKSSSAPALGAILTGFDNPESGVVFLENFFETYDWEAFQHSPDLAIPELDEVIYNNKAKNGAIPETWYLDFMALYVPVAKKFEALDLIGKDIVEKFNPVDTTEIVEFFGVYHSIAKVLFAEKKRILKALGSAIGFAEKFQLPANRLAILKANYSDLEKKFASIITKTVKSKKKDEDFTEVVVDTIEEIPAYAAAKKEYADKKKAEFMARGIDADDVYARAVAAYESGDSDGALALFETIREYSDSATYIKKINHYFIFRDDDDTPLEDKMFRFAGRHFIYKMEDYTKETLNVKRITKKTQQRLNTAGKGVINALSLYEVVDGVPAEEPTLRGIDRIITLYGSKLFYFKTFPAGCNKTEKCIACYDFKTDSEVQVDSGKPEAYFGSDNKHYGIYVSNYGPYFVFKKKFIEDAKGCLGNKKKGTVVINELNPFSLVLVDMVRNTSRVLVDKMVEVTMRGDDKLFYTYAYKDDGAGCLKGCSQGCRGKKIKDKPKSCVMVCDIGKGTVNKVLDDDCDIQYVMGDKIIYTLWVPNDLNEDLHIYDMATGVDTLIEKNVYEFYGVVNNKLYYYIGNEEFRPFICNNFEGTDRAQIMSNVVKIERVIGNWFYIKKGRGYNSVLIKVRADGKDAKIICTSYLSICRLDGNYIYYLGYGYDCYNLKVVRIDGQDDKILAQKVSKVFPAEDGLYYYREEDVSDTQSNFSIYHMDRDGLNIKKVAFDVDFIQNDPDTNSIYFSRKQETRFKVYLPGKEDKAHYEFFTLNKFYRFFKATETEEATEPELLLTTGLPKNDPRGCIAKILAYIRPDFIYEEAPIIHSYKNRGMTDAEIMADEDEELEVKNNLPSWMNKLVGKNGASKTVSKNNNGCAGCAPKKAKNSNRKQTKSAGSIIYAVWSIVLAYMAFMFTMLGLDSVVKIVFGIVAAFLGLCGLGVVPVLKFKPKKVFVILFIIAAIFLIFPMGELLSDIF